MLLHMNCIKGEKYERKKLCVGRFQAHELGLTLQRVELHIRPITYDLISQISELR